MAAGVLLFDADGRVLLVEPTYKPYWELPGGVVEADESPHTAACRELKECTRAEAARLLKAAQSRRVEASLDARAAHTVAYLENASPLDSAGQEAEPLGPKE
jgi:ADP-ribose pyrophosphatase YjhB (NUDIX family)